MTSRLSRADIEEHLERIARATRALDEFVRIHSIGDVVLGRVVDHASGGVLVELVPDVVGAIKPTGVAVNAATGTLSSLKVGDHVEVTLTSVDPVIKHINLSFIRKTKRTSRVRKQSSRAIPDGLRIPASKSLDHKRPEISGKPSATTQTGVTLGGFVIRIALASALVVAIACAIKFIAASPGPARILSDANPTQALISIQNQDASKVEHLTGHWVPQLASNKTDTSGVTDSYWDMNTLHEHRSLQASYDAVLVRSDDFATSRRGYWLSIARIGFNTSRSALAWCDTHGRVTDNQCFARYLTTTPGEAEVKMHGR